MAIFTPRPLTSGKGPLIQLDRRLGGPYSWFGRSSVEKETVFPRLFGSLYRQATAPVTMVIFIMIIYTLHIIKRIIQKGHVARMRKKKYIQKFCFENQNENDNLEYLEYVKGKVITLQARCGPEGG